MLVHIAVRTAVIISLTGTITYRNVLLCRRHVAIMVMVKSETGTVMTIMMFDQTRPSMNVPENKGESYQQEGNSSEHGGATSIAAIGSQRKLEAPNISAGNNQRILGLPLIPESIDFSQ